LLRLCQRGVFIRKLLGEKGIILLRLAEVGSLLLVVKEEASGGQY